jgi:hypothetical protein
MSTAIAFDSLSSADRVKLLELYARSVMLLDLGRCEEWADLFEARALVRCTRVGGVVASEQFQGRAELFALGQRMIRWEFDIALGRLNPPVRGRHQLSNITLFGKGSCGAQGYGYLTVTTIGGPDPPRWLASGRYTDALRKCPAGCWRFESRTFEADDGGKTVRTADQLVRAAVIT